MVNKAFASDSQIEQISRRWHRLPACLCVPTGSLYCSRDPEWRRNTGQISKDNALDHLNCCRGQMVALFSLLPMRAKVLRIHWHDKKAVFSVEFDPCDSQRFVTAGGDNNIRVVCHLHGIVISARTRSGGSKMSGMPCRNTVLHSLGM